MASQDEQRRHWPELPYTEWQDTCKTLHLGRRSSARSAWRRRRGKSLVARTLYVTSAGSPLRRFRTGPFVPDRLRFRRPSAAHPMRSRWRAPWRCEPSRSRISTAACSQARGAPGRSDDHGRPNEVPDAIPFAEDHVHAAYDPDTCGAFIGAARGRACSSGSDCVPRQVEPGAFLLGQLRPRGDALLRSAGAAAPGGISNLPDDVTREAYSHEVSSAGFWPGGGPLTTRRSIRMPIPRPRATRARADPPKPTTQPRPASSLPYDVVRTSPDPELALSTFLETTYRAAADAAHWDRAALECPRGVPGVPRAI